MPDIHSLIDEARKNNNPYFMQSIEDHLKNHPQDSAYLLVKALCYWHGWNVPQNMLQATEILKNIKTDELANDGGAYIVIQYYKGYANKMGSGCYNKDEISALSFFYHAMKADKASPYFKFSETEAKPLLAEYLAEDKHIGSDNPTLLNVLGCYLWSGYGVEQNRPKAGRYYQAAINKGNPYANYNFADKYFDSDNNVPHVIYYLTQSLKDKALDKSSAKTVVTDLEVLAQKKNIKPIDNTPHSRDLFRALGICYIEGYGCAQDKAKGIDYLKTVVSQGDEQAHYYLADAYNNAQYLSLDNKKSATYFVAAASRGEAGNRAIERLKQLADIENPSKDNADFLWGYSECLRHGWGTAKDTQEWLRFAEAALEHQADKNTYGYYFETLLHAYIFDESVKDYTKAGDFFRQYIQNVDSEADITESLKHLEQALKQEENASILIALGEYHCKANDKSKELLSETAIDYFLHAAKAGPAGFTYIAQLAIENPNNTACQTLQAICQVEEWGIQGKQAEGLAFFNNLYGQDNLSYPIHDIAHYYLGYAHENGLSDYQSDIIQAVRYYNLAKKVASGSKYGKEKAKDAIREILPQLLYLADNEKKEDGMLLHQLGFIYGRGVVVPKNYSTSLVYYERAAATKDDIYGCYNSGLYYFTGAGAKKNLIKAIDYFCRALEKQDLRQAQREVSFKNVMQAIAENPELYTSAVKSVIGICYLHGIGTNQDREKGIKLLAEAAEAGDEKAQYQLGLAYEADNDIDTASQWYLAAAMHNTQNDNGTIAAVQRLAALADIENPTPENASCLHRYAVCLQHGYGVVKDEQATARYYTAAKSLGHAASWENLIDLYLQPESMQNIKQVVNEISADLQNPDVNEEIKQLLLSKLEQVASSLLNKDYGCSSTSEIILEEYAGDDTIEVVLALGRIYLQHCQNDATFYKKACDYYISLWQNPRISENQLSRVALDLRTEEANVSSAIIRIISDALLKIDSPRSLDLIYHNLARAYKLGEAADLGRAAYYHFQAAKVHAGQSEVSKTSAAELVDWADNYKPFNPRMAYYAGHCCEFGLGIAVDIPSAENYYQQIIAAAEHETIFNKLEKSPVESDNRLFDNLVDKAVFDSIEQNAFSKAENLIMFYTGTGVVQAETRNNYLHILVEKAEAELAAELDRKQRVAAARAKGEDLALPQVELNAFNFLQKVLHVGHVNHLIKQQNAERKTPLELAKSSSIITMFADTYRTDSRDEAHYGKALYAALLKEDFVAATALKDAGAPYELVDDANNNIFHTLATIQKDKQAQYNKLIERYTKFYKTLLLDKDVEMSPQKYIATLVLEKNSDKVNPLDIAIAENNEHAIKVFCTLLNWNPLHLSVYKNDLAGTEKAIQAGIDPIARDNLDCTPISLAGSLGHWSLVEKILPQPKDVTRADRWPLGKVLHWAVTHGQTVIAQQLIDLGASTRWQPDTKKPTKDPLLHVALRRIVLQGESFDLIKLLLDYVPSGKIDPNALTLDGKTLLQVAVEARNNEALIHILSKTTGSIDVTKKNTSGKTVFDILNTMRCSPPRLPDLIKIKRKGPEGIDIPADWNDRAEQLTESQVTAIRAVTKEWNQMYAEWQQQEFILDEMEDLLIKAEKQQNRSLLDKAAEKYDAFMFKAQPANVDAKNDQNAKIEEPQSFSLLEKIAKKYDARKFKALSANMGGPSDEDADADADADNAASYNFL
jgi:TPR repeat protein/ankyrin repeat protein